MIEFLGKILRTAKHQIVTDAGLLAASQYVATGLSFITAIGAARILGPLDYGITALIIAYPNLLWSFVGIKSISVTTRYMANFRAIQKNEELKGICKLGYSLDFFIAVVAFVLVSITSWWVAHHFYNMPNIWWLMVCYAASIPIFSLTETSRAILFSWQRFRWLSIFQILDKLIMLFLILGFLLAGFGVRGMIIATALGQAIMGVIMMVATTYLLFRDGLGFWWKCSLKSIIPLQKELGSIFGWNYLFVTLRGLVTYLPQMLLGYFRGPQEAGFYRLATSMVTVGSYPETSLGRIAYPILSSYWSEEKPENLKSTLRRWTFYGGIPMGILTLLTIPLISVFVPAVFGSDYSLMIPGVKVMMAGAVISTVFFWLTSFYYALGRVAIWTKGYALYTAIVIVLGWFCIQQWGFLGLAILITTAKIVFTLSMTLGFPESPLRNSGQE